MENTKWLTDYNKIIIRVVEWAAKNMQLSSIEVLDALKVAVYSGTEVTSKGVLTGQNIRRAFERKSTIVGLERCFPSSLAGVISICHHVNILAIRVRVVVFGQEIYLAVTETEVVELFR